MSWVHNFPLWTKHHKKQCWLSMLHGDHMYMNRNSNMSKMWKQSHSDNPVSRQQGALSLATPVTDRLTLTDHTKMIAICQPAYACNQRTRRKVLHFKSNFKVLLSKNWNFIKKEMLFPVKMQPWFTEKNFTNDTNTWVPSYSSVSRTPQTPRLSAGWSLPTCYRHTESHDCPRPRQCCSPPAIKFPFIFSTCNHTWKFVHRKLLSIATTLLQLEVKTVLWKLLVYTHQRFPMKVLQNSFKYS